MGNALSVVCLLRKWRTTYRLHFTTDKMRVTTHSHSRDERYRVGCKPRDADVRPCDLCLGTQMLGSPSSQVLWGLQYLFPGAFYLKFKWIDLEVGLGCNSLFEANHVRWDSYEPVHWQQAMDGWGCDHLCQHSQAVEEAAHCWSPESMQGHKSRWLSPGARWAPAIVWWAIPQSRVMSMLNSSRGN